MGASSVQNNVLDAGEVAITVWHGGNGFKISNNTFLPTGSFADIWLGGATASDDFPPDSHDNTVVAGASVTRVLDFGRDNKLLGKKIVLLNPGLAPLALARLNGHKARVLAEITTQ